jgi:hypothetical protein
VSPARRRWLAATLGALILIGACVRVTITDPRIHVRWDESISAAERNARERAYELHEGVLVDATADTWRYALADSSRANIGALLNDPAVADVAYIDRDTLSSEGRDVELTVRYPFSDLLDSPRDLLRLHRSVWLLLAGGVLLWGAWGPTVSGRRALAVVTLLATAAATTALPHDPSMVTMGGSADHVRSRADFEEWFGGRVRFEKHLSQVLLLQIYAQSGTDERAPQRAVVATARFATVWFIGSALAIGFVEGWSPIALRYLGLALLAPSALLYFGWRELGYLSLNLAAFPLLARGILTSGFRLEAASALAGLGAALHGSGLVAVAGTWLTIAGAPPGPDGEPRRTMRRLRERAGGLLRSIAWVTTAYVGWIAIYIIVLKLPVSPDPGQAAFSSWRPWTLDEIRAGRVAAAIFSATGARDIAMSAWIVGAPLLPLVLSLWRQYPQAVRMALWYLPPSVLFVILRWPFEGVGGGMDLVVAGFPAFYALAWVCAHDAKRTGIAAVLLASAHYAFWRVVLDQRFEP